MKMEDVFGNVCWHKEEKHRMPGGLYAIWAMAVAAAVYFAVMSLG